MKKLMLATLVLGLGAGTASAAPLALNGSDTLFDFTTHLLSTCGVSASQMTYAGGGSGLGENNMVATPPQQQIAPMSKAMTATRVTAGVSQGVKVALDALGIFTDANTSNGGNTCNTGVHSATMTIEDLNGVAGIDDGTGAAQPDTDGAGNYVFSDWRDVLRIVYGGQTAHKHSITSDVACNEAPIARDASDNSTQRCNSDVRNTLVAHWGNLFQEAASCNSSQTGGCTQLRHAFRRDDASGTTDVFDETIGLPKIAGGATPINPHCNGAEMQDEDPIRRDCSETNTVGDEQVCNSVARSLLGPTNNLLTALLPGWRGGPTANPPDANSADLGLVLSVVIPTTGAYQDTTACSNLNGGGSFRYVVMPAGAVSNAQQKCPDGNKRVGGQCQWPARKSGTNYFFGCVNKKTNVPGARTTTNIDGRVYNLIARNADGTMQTVERIVSGLPQSMPVHHAVYRIHETAVMPGGTGTGCRFVDATDQIGCLVHASPCSIGYAGMGAAQRGPNKALALHTPLHDCTVDGLDNDGNGTVDEAGENCAVTASLANPTTIRYLNDPFFPATGVAQPAGTCGDAAAYAAGHHYDSRYPLARNLWFNSIKGFATTADPDPYHFANIDDTFAEQTLMKCAADKFYADEATTFAGFVTLNSNVCASAGLGGSCLQPIRTY